MKAVCTIREQPSYRADAFRSGLKRVGYSLVPLHQRGHPESAADLLVLWNVHRETEAAARDWEAAGGTVLVCENGYVGADGQGRQLYAIAAHGHNGSGWFPVGEADRFSALGLVPAAFANGGEHLVICGQRGVGSKEMASPPNWHYQVAERLKKATKRAVRVRLHPGNKGPAPSALTLADELRGAWACVVWSSSSGVKSLLAGIPVFYGAPHWICEGAAERLNGSVESPKRDDAARLSALRRMAWAQWTVDEIESGEPFVRIREAALVGAH